jgi:calcineurin-like phosphoesterase family protein
MAIFFTSDHHFGHFNVIKYCNRPFESVQQMDELMILAWNETVLPDDEVYYLGDFAMKSFLVPKILPRLHGRKYLIMGNHDRCFKGNSDRWKSFYTDAGFESLDREQQIEIANQSVRLNHFPYRNPHDPDQRYFDHRPQDDGGWLLHGHVHHRWKIKGKQINVSVDVWDFKPIPLAQIENIILAEHHD